MNPLGRPMTERHHGGMMEHAVRDAAEVRVLVIDDQDPFRRGMAAGVEATDGPRDGRGNYLS